MSLSPLSASTPITAPNAVSTSPAPRAGLVTADTAAIGGGAAGAYMAQGGGAPADASGGTGSLVKKMLVGGVVGAGVGFGATFINPLMALITTTTPVGWGIKAAAAGIGAAVGAGGAALLHFIGKRKANLAMQAQAQGLQPTATPPQAVPTPTGPTLRIGSQGTGTRELQTQLKSIGLFPHKVSGSFDKPTSNAIRRYEVLKGVVPTGLGSPEVREAIKQDAALAKQYV